MHSNLWIGFMVGKYLLANDDQVVSDKFGAEIFVVNFRNGRYYAMRGAATEIWTLLQHSQTLESIMRHLNAAFGDLPSEAIKEISLFLDLLEAEDLASRSSTPPAGDGNDIGVVRDQAYQAPILDVYDDLSELIVIDPVHEVDNERGWPVQPAS